MKQLNLFSIIFTFVLLLMAPKLTTAAITQEAAEIPYQINNSDHIVIGTISEIDNHSDYRNNIIAVKEWLYNPLPAKTIVVRTSISFAEEARFTQNESVLLMLKDIEPDKKTFDVFLGNAGKYPVSDRDRVVKELKAQGKWKIENQIGNETENETNKNGMTANKEHEGKQEGNSNSTQESNNAPFISPIWVFAVVLWTVLYISKTK
jgi:hypothetical protein